MQAIFQAPHDKEGHWSPEGTTAAQPRAEQNVTFHMNCSVARVSAVNVTD